MSAGGEPEGPDKATALDKEIEKGIDDLKAMLG